MRIIKHATRRRKLRSFEDNGFLVVEGSHSVGSVEEAVEIAMDVWSQEIAAARQAPTLWEIYRAAWHN